MHEKDRDLEGPPPGWCAYARRAKRPKLWDGSTSRARATFFAFFAVLPRPGSPLSAFRGVVAEIPARRARTRLVIPCSPRRARTSSAFGSTLMYFFPSRRSNSPGAGTGRWWPARVRFGRWSYPRQLAAKVGSHRDHIGRLERDEVANPRMSTIRKLAEALKEEPTELIGSD